MLRLLAWLCTVSWPRLTRDPKGGVVGRPINSVIEVDKLISSTLQLRRSPHLRTPSLRETQREALSRLAWVYLKAVGAMSLPRGIRGPSKASNSSRRGGLKRGQGRSIVHCKGPFEVSDATFTFLAVVGR
jgi:hypothetical protein